MDDFGVIVIFVIIIYLVAQVMKSPEKPAKPQIKADPNKKTQEKFAVQILTEQTTPEEIAEKEGYDIEHIKQWVQNYIKYAVSYSLDAKKINAHIDLLTDDIACLKEICRKYIGDDWEEKTDYQNRSRNRYK